MYILMGELPLDRPTPQPTKQNIPITEETERSCEFPRDDDIHKREESNTSSSEVLINDNQGPIKERIVISELEEIAISGMGTAVYKWTYEGRSYAVKRIIRCYRELADQESKIFEKCGYQQNVIKYYGKEDNDSFIFLVLELCDCNLYDLIEKPNDHLVYQRNVLGNVKLWNEDNCHLRRPSRLLLKLLRDIICGLIHLHKLDIVHRDIKPQNVLITTENSTLCAKICDFGMSICLLDDKSCLSDPNSYCGTTGWKPKECFHPKGEQTTAIDMFSLGCVIFFCITSGTHPFGAHGERDKNIKENIKKNMHLVEDIPEAFHLISSLLEPDHKSRPQASVVLHHPLFWDAKKRLFFLRDVLDRVNKDSNLFKVLESKRAIVLGTETICMVRKILKWNKKMDKETIRHILLHVKRKYKFNRIRDLLQLIKDILSYYEQLYQDIQITVESQYEGLNDYFTRKFPMLLMEVFKAVCTCNKEWYFSAYFEGESI